MYQVDELTEQLLGADRLQRFREVADERLGCLTVGFEYFVDPRNVSACLRSAEAFGLQEVHVIREDSYSPNRGVTRKADRWLQVHRHTDTRSCLSHWRDAGYTIWATTLSPGAVSAFDLDLPPRLAILMGSEHSGLSDLALAAADRHVIIPMAGFTQSLNVSTAATVLLQHLAHRFRRERGDAALLPPADRVALFQAWCQRDVDSKLRRNPKPRTRIRPQTTYDDLTTQDSRS